MANKTMFQAFEWYLKPDYTHWNHLSSIAKALKSMKISMAWLPPAYKEFRFLPETPDIFDDTAIDAVGYGVYDRYDLGQFPSRTSKDHPGVTPTYKTKYGTKVEYEKCIEKLHSHNIDVICDIVINHMFGADDNEDVSADKYDANDRTRKISGPHTISAPTKFTFPLREGTYSTETWDANDFNAVSYDNKEIFLFEGKEFNKEVDRGYTADMKNYDYLMGSNIDMNHQPTVDKLINWLNWYMDVTKADGVRLDAVKHISYLAMPAILQAVREKAGKKFFAVGEYWADQPEVADRLLKYLDEMEPILGEADNQFTLFDVPLHKALSKASSSNGEFDMRHLFKDSLLRARPDSAVTFVDNHDTQTGQMLGPEVLSWFKKHAYSLILFQKDGIPCVFYGDMYGVQKKVVVGETEDNQPVFEYQMVSYPVQELPLLCRLRHSCAHGAQKNYYIAEPAKDECQGSIEDQTRRRQVIGYTRAGLKDYKYSGMAVIVTNGIGGHLTMHVHARYKNQLFYNILDDPSDPKYGPVKLTEDGDGDFYVHDGDAAVWVSEAAYRKYR